MESYPRPDLGRILPQPAVARVRTNEAMVGQVLGLAARRPAEDFLLDVTPRADGDADAPGFGITQATAVAARIAARLAVPDATDRDVHRLDPVRVHGLLDRDGP